MKSKYIFLSLILALVSLTGCNDSSRGTVSVLEIYPTISNNRDWLTITDTTVVPLETTEKSLLGRISEVHNENSDWYILTRENSVFKFDKAGKFVYSIDSKGNGPGEFMRISAMCIDNGHIYLNECNQAKVCVYDTDGKWIKDIIGTDSLKFAMSMKPLGDGRILIANNISFNNDIPLYGIWDPNAPQHLTPIIDTEYTSNGSYGWAMQPLASYHKDFLVLKPLSSTVYRMNIKTSECDSLINIADILPNGLETSGDYQKAFLNVLKLKGNPVMGISTCGDFAFISMLHSFAVVYLPTGEWWYTSTVGVSLDKSPLPFMTMPIICSIDNSVVCAVEAATYLDVYAEMPEFDRINHVKVDPEDNPILIIYTLRYSG